MSHYRAELARFPRRTAIIIVQADSPEKVKQCLDQVIEYADTYDCWEDDYDYFPNTELIFEGSLMEIQEDLSSDQVDIVLSESE